MHSFESAFVRLHGRESLAPSRSFALNQLFRKLVLGWRVARFGQILEIIGRRTLDRHRAGDRLTWLENRLDSRSTLAINNSWKITSGEITFPEELNLANQSDLQEKASEYDSMNSIPNTEQNFEIASPSPSLPVPISLSLTFGDSTSSSSSSFGLSSFAFSMRQVAIVHALQPENLRNTPEHSHEIVCLYAWKR